MDKDQSIEKWSSMDIITDYLGVSRESATMFRIGTHNGETVTPFRQQKCGSIRIAWILVARPLTEMSIANKRVLWKAAQQSRFIILLSGGIKKLIFSWIDHHARAILCVALALILLLAGILVWGKLHPPVTVTFESREQATTPAGVEKAATAAQVSISPSQAADIANVIKEGEDRAPDAVVQTTGESLEATVKTVLQKSGGQFAIVTESKKPASVLAPAPASGKAVAALANARALSPSTQVTLNQYNIKAYPERLIQVGGSYQEVFAAYSWKVDVPKIPLVTPHGAVGYLGVYGHVNFDRADMSRVGIMLTIPN